MSVENNSLFVIQNSLFLDEINYFERCLVEVWSKFG